MEEVRQFLNASPPPKKLKPKDQWTLDVHTMHDVLKEQLRKTIYAKLTNTSFQDQFRALKAMYGIYIDAFYERE